MAYTMITNGATSAEAARTCGYNSIGNFSAAFSEYFGEAPVQYKQAGYSAKTSSIPHTSTS